ncbi:MAG TPA: mycofactocin-associated electron transfer flavoprotein beta subunit [Mycobacteriales bacterium]
MTSAVLLKRVDLRPEVDALTGELTPDAHGGLSAADRCALELALRSGDGDVLAVTAGPPASESVLREALEAGCTAAVRVDLPTVSTSADVAAALARVVAGRDLVWCGEHSLDRGSGSVPAFVAAELGVAQALGCVQVDIGPPLHLVRRLDRGRRETLTVSGPAVISVEAGVVTARRPSLAAVLAARESRITVVTTEAPPSGGAGVVAAYRPRARVLPGPDSRLSPRERLVALSGALVDREPPRVIQVEPGEAADEVLAFLRERSTP